MWRALFFIALAAVFLPHEPDLGLGRPGAASMLPAQLAGLFGASAKTCEDRDSACATALAPDGDLQGQLMGRLDRLRQEIKADRAERRAHRHARDTGSNDESGDSTGTADPIAGLIRR